MANRNARPSRAELTEFILACLPEPPADIQFENHGSIFLIRGVSDAGQVWLDENVGNAATRYWGKAVVCEPRYVADIAHGAIEARLVVR